MTSPGDPNTWGSGESVLRPFAGRHSSATRFPTGLARGFTEAAPSPIREIANAAALRPEVIRLEVGDPDFRTPDHIGGAGLDAILEGDTNYTATQGRESLRRAIAWKVERVNGYRPAIDEIVCSTGGTAGLTAGMAVILEHGDELLVPDPCWPSYVLMTTLLGVRPVRYECPRSRGYVPDAQVVENLITTRTRAILINSPSNPTGAVFPADAMRALVQLAVARGLWILSDESYDEIVFGEPSVSPATLVDDGRVISFYTFSKTYSMTGWRLGYAVAAPPVALGMIKALQAMTASPSAIAQRAGEAALDGSQDCVRATVAKYKARRDRAVRTLSDAGLLSAVPFGTMFILADISPSGMGSTEFARRLLEEQAVAVAPGVAFGSATEGTVRIALTAPDHQILEGIRRLVSFVRSV